MALTTCTHPQTDTHTPPPYSNQWHRQQEDEERAWLDTFILDPSIAVTLWKAPR